jgi:Protein of unknown function (DUF3352)
MSNVRRSFILPVLAAAVLSAGCGSSEPSLPAAASVAPASSELFLTVDTSFDSDQWNAARALLEKFPDGDRAVSFFLDELSNEGIDVEGDLEPALGPETAIVGLDLFADEAVVVGLTQPEDEQKLRDLLEKSDEPVSLREIGGWTAFADSDAILDRFEDERANGTLDGSEDFATALGEVEADALARLYLSGAALQEVVNAEAALPPGALDVILPGGKIPSIALALRAEESGVRLEGAARLAGNGTSALFPEPFAAELPNELPAGAIVYVGFRDLDRQLGAIKEFFAQVNPEFDADVARIEAQLGLSLEEDVFPLFAGEGAFVVRPGFVIPELTLVTHVEDEEHAVETLDRLAAALAEYLPVRAVPQPTEIAGVEAKELMLAPPFALYYAAFDGRLVLTTSRDGIASLREEGDRLADDSDFRSALDAAGVPDETTGTAYVNVKEAVRNLLGLAEMGGAELPPELAPNLEPLQGLVVYGAKDGQTVRFTAFLAVD